MSMNLQSDAQGGISIDLNGRDNLPGLVPVLNTDVMVHIMEVLPRPSLSLLMKTCCTFYSIGVPMILQDIVCIRRQGQMDSFHDFMFATSPGPSDRFEYLHGLEWVDPLGRNREQAEPLNSPFLSIISRASFLKKLVLHYWGRIRTPRPDEDPYGVDLLVSLPELEEVEIYEGPRDVLRFLERTRAPIKKLTYRFIHSDDLSNFEFLSSIVRLRDTLVSLDLQHFQLAWENTDLRFPKVRQLYLDADRYTGFAAPLILSIFPNLETLSLPDPTPHLWYQYSSESEIERQHTRTSAIGDKLGSSQQSIENLSGCAVDLYRTACQCPVGCLQVEYLSKSNLRWLLPLLPKMRPRHLVLKLNLHLEGATEILSSISQALSATDNLESLTLVLLCRGDTYGIVQPVVEGLPSVLQQSTFQSFKITYSSKFQSYRNEVYWHEELDYLDFVARVLLAARNLREFTIQRGPDTYITFRVPVGFIYEQWDCDWLGSQKMLPLPSQYALEEYCIWHSIASSSKETVTVVVPKLAEQPDFQIEIQHPTVFERLALTFPKRLGEQSNTRVQPHEQITRAFAKVSMALSRNDSDHGLTDKIVGCGDISTTAGTIGVKSGAPVLNLDVVSSIMALSDRPSVSHFMKACRQYHSIGVPILLRFPVSFYALRFVDSFYLFMFTTTMDRFQFLKDVTIKRAHNTSYSKRKNHAYQSKILRILSHATSLEKLSLVDVDRLLDNFPGAIGQLAGLTMLREVACADSRKLLDWVGQLRAPLTKLSFTLDDGNEPVDLLSTIPHFHATLRSLSVAYVFFDPDNLSLRFPLVNDLAVDTVYAGMFSACYSASTIFRLFPNLKSLTFPDEPLDVNFLAFAQRDIRERHEEHMAAATRDNVVDKVLDELTGCISDLYRGAYICRVKDLWVHYLDDENALWLIPLLVHMQPSYLSLAFRLCDSGFGTMPALLQIFQEVSTLNTLRHLSLDLDFEEANYGAAQCIVEELPEVLRHVAITRLTITWWNVDEFTDNHDFLRREVDWREVVLRILLVALTLRVVEIQTLMPPFFSTKVFRIPKNLVKKAHQRFKGQAAAVMDHLRPRISCSD